jgi:hypothetical protein
MTAILEWAMAEGLDTLTLSTSEDGRVPYESLGFTALPEMHLPVKRNP